jgi:hypothetical protein
MRDEIGLMFLSDIILKSLVHNNLFSAQKNIVKYFCEGAIIPSISVTKPTDMCGTFNILQKIFLNNYLYYIY